jgi:hypothetical protein
VQQVLDCAVAGGSGPEIAACIAAALDLVPTVQGVLACIIAGGDDLAACIAGAFGVDDAVQQVLACAQAGGADLPLAACVAAALELGPQVQGTLTCIQQGGTGGEIAGCIAGVIAPDHAPHIQAVLACVVEHREQPARLPDCVRTALGR